MSRAAPGRAPWTPPDLLRCYSLNGLAVLVAVSAWWISSGSVRASVGGRALALGVGALVISGAANCRWLLIGRRAVVERRASLRDTLSRHPGVVPAGPPAPGPAQPEPALVAVPRGTRYHRATCQLVQAKPAQPDSLAGHQRSGRQPCGICLP